jgi:membrane-bound serine protease (ClpP class)
MRIKKFIKLLSVLLLCFGFNFGSLKAEGPTNTTSKVQIPYLLIDDSINMGVQLRVERAIATAKETGAPAVFIELDTPGGYLEVTRRMVQSFLVSDILIVVYVSPQGARAASAGAMITMAAHYAAMAPSTSIGAATPVAGGGKEMEGDMKNKVTNDTIAFVEGIAEKRGRNKEFAKLSVSEAASLTSSDALEQNVIDGVFESREEVWVGARKKFPTLPENIHFNELEMNLKEKTMSLLSNPNVAMGLMALGMLGIYMEMNSPGLIVPGLVGVTALALGAFSTQIIPIQTGAIILLVLGLIFLAIEFLSSWATFGVAGIASLIMFFLSGLFLMDGEQADMHLDPGLWIPIFITFAIGVGLMTLYSIKALRSKSTTYQGVDGLVGKIAEVSKVHDHHVSLKVIGEVWAGEAIDDTQMSELKPGMQVEIVKQEGLKLYFKRRN